MADSTASQKNNNVVYAIKTPKQIHGRRYPIWMNSGVVIRSKDGRLWGRIDQRPWNWDGQFALFDIGSEVKEDPPDIEQEPF